MIPTPVPGFTLRFARPDDIPLILELIREMGEYTRLSHEISATGDSLRDSLFGPRPVAEVVIAGYQGRPAGFLVFFHNFSTFVGRAGLYLEDIYVKPELRGRGLGRVMLAWLARLALERGCRRLEWAVLDWNEPAIALYRRAGAVAKEDWTVWRLSGARLEALAGEWQNGTDD